VSYISSDADLSGPRAGRAWRADDGSVHVTVRLSEVSTSTLFFDSADDARSVAAACTQAAEAWDRVAAETGKDSSDGN
jgi:hypothetical protein